MNNLIAQSQFQLIRLYFTIVGAISPRIAAKKANELMAKPRIFPIKEREKVMLERATLVNYQFRGAHIQGYQWGTGSRTVVLVHGWEGQAGNFGYLIDMLIANECTVIAFDAPAHGRSAVEPTSMFAFGAFVSGFINQQRPDIVISHSFGSVAAITAMAENPELYVDKVVMITSPNRFSDRIHQVAEMFGLSPRVEQALTRQIEQETGYVVADLNVSDYAQRTNVNAALIVHGQNDQLVPMAWSKEIVTSWKKATLIEVEGAGHYRVLWHDETRKAVEAFLFE